MILKMIQLDQGWEATPTWVSESGYIATVQLKNAKTGKVVDRTRFDSGKLRFLDHREEFPDFKREDLLRLAKEIAAEVQGR